MVSAAAASVSTSAAALRDAVTVSFPAACTLTMYRMFLGCAWALLRGESSWWLRNGTAGGKVVGFCNLLQTFRDLFQTRGD